MEQERADAGHLWLLDTGDAWAGGRQNGTATLGDETEGAVIVAAMNALAYDAMALGPYELALGAEVLAERLAEASFPVVSANAYDASGERVVPPYTVLEASGHRVAVVGLTRVPEAELPGFDVREERAELEALLPELEGAAHAVVVLTSLPLDEAQTRLGPIAALDLVVAALPSPLPDHVLRPGADGPGFVVAERPTPGHTGRRVGRLELALAVDGTVADESWRTIGLGPELADDADMAALLESHAAELPLP